MDMLYSSATELVTSRQETRTGFIEFALEKNKRSKPFIESAKAFRHFSMQARTPSELLTIKEIREPLLTASGLSDKSLRYFTDEDKIFAIEELIRNFLEPAGDDFVEEVVYRYLLIKGDTLGGSMRNAIGAFAQQKLIRSLLSVMSGIGMDYHWLSTEKRSTWKTKPDDDFEIENKMKAISWKNEHGSRTFAFNLRIYP
jgi:type II restriction enzyme